MVMSNFVTSPIRCGFPWFNRWIVILNMKVTCKIYTFKTRGAAYRFFVDTKESNTALEAMIKIVKR